MSRRNPTDKLGAWNQVQCGGNRQPAETYFQRSSKRLVDAHGGALMAVDRVLIHRKYHLGKVSMMKSCLMYLNVPWCSLVNHRG